MACNALERGTTPKRDSMERTSIVPTIKYQVIFPKYGENSARQLVYVNKERGRDPERVRVSQFRELLSTKDSASGYDEGSMHLWIEAKAGGSIA